MGQEALATVLNIFSPLGASVYNTQKAATTTKKAAKAQEDALNSAAARAAAAPGEAEAAAKEAAKKRRRISLLSGGETDLTYTLGNPAAGNLQSKSLLGG